MTRRLVMINRKLGAVPDNVMLVHESVAETADAMNEDDRTDYLRLHHREQLRHRPEANWMVGDSRPTELEGDE